jgi:queuine tRNA-ribosyltransferase
MFMSKVSYRIVAQQGKARVWQLSLNGVTLRTPCFMPVGTRATIKWLILDLLKQEAYVGQHQTFSLILANTFHLYLRPGDQLIKQAWWLHRFENRDKLILTDSGWFQVFSLGLSKSGKGLVTLMDDGVRFQSPIDGSTHIFTPTKVVDIQSNLWSDIMMVLDVCSPVAHITKDQVASQMKLTHRRADQAFEYFMPRYDQTRGCLRPIVQWGIYPDLRQESVSYLSQYAIDGIAIGWLSVWESKEDMYQTLATMSDYLPHHVPRYLMGVGTVQDLKYAISQGIDMFDCVHPTRLGRHGGALTSDLTLKLHNSKYRNDLGPLTQDCGCHTCRNYSRAYLHHLVSVWESLGGILLSLHNICYLHKLVTDIQNDILSQS